MLMLLLLLSVVMVVAAAVLSFNAPASLCLSFHHDARFPLIFPAKGRRRRRQHIGPVAFFSCVPPNGQEYA